MNVKEGFEGVGERVIFMECLGGELKLAGWGRVGNEEGG